MLEPKQKNYYSLNLTEGRIFIIFISMIILMVIIIFGCIILISNNAKSKEINLTTSEKDEFKNIKDDSFSFYSSLEEESRVIYPNDHDNNSKNYLIKNTNLQNNLKTNIQEEIKNTSKLKNNEIKTTSDQDKHVRINNSEILYSSNYYTPSPTPPTPKIYNKKSSTQKKYTKQESSNSNKKYIVQIGSYLNKKTADNISLFYKGQGYPTFIRNKTSNGKIYYRLRIGPFKEKKNAEKHLASLKVSKYGKSSYISIVYL